MVCTTKLTLFTFCFFQILQQLFVYKSLTSSRDCCFYVFLGIRWLRELNHPFLHHGPFLKAFHHVFSLTNYGPNGLLKKRYIERSNRVVPFKKSTWLFSFKEYCMCTIQKCFPKKASWNYHIHFMSDALSLSR